MNIRELDKHIIKESDTFCLYEFDAFFLKIKDNRKYVIISISFKSFTNTSDAMCQRPYVNVYHITKPATLDFAKEKACWYLTYLQTSISAPK